MFKVDNFLYIIQIMLQYTPSFNKVCYTFKTARLLSINILCKCWGIHHALGGSFIYTTSNGVQPVDFIV